MNNDKELEEIFENLPDEMASRLISSDLVLKVKRIGEIHELNKDQINVLQTIIALAFLGQLSFDDILPQIDETIIASDIQLDAIKNDIENQVIIPFIDELKQKGITLPEEEAKTSIGQLRKSALESSENKPLLKDVLPVKDIPETREEIQEGIEHPSPSIVEQAVATEPQVPVIVPGQVAEETSILDAKLNAQTSLPKQEIKMNESTPIEVKKEISTMKYPDADPYREPPTA